MKKFNTILSFTSLVFTSFLLVFLIFAWYATNKTANVNNAVGSVADIDNIVEEVRYYKFIKKASGENTYYNIDSYVISDNTGLLKKKVNYSDEDHTTYTNTTVVTNDTTLTMNKYDELNRLPSYYFIRIKLKKNEGISSLSFYSTASHFIGFDSNGTKGVISNNKNLSLSSVIRYRLLGTASISGDSIANSDSYISNNGYQVSFTPEFAPEDNSNNWHHFEYTNQVNSVTHYYYGGITQSKVQLNNSALAPDTDESLYIYLLLDYNSDAISNFYGYNLGNDSILNADNGPEFSKKDFEIFLLG